MNELGTISTNNADKKMMTGQNFVSSSMNQNNNSHMMTNTATSFGSSMGQKISSIKKQSPATKY